MSNIGNVLEQFDIDGVFQSAEAYGNGHINDTYLIKVSSNNTEKKYILRRINSYVFNKPLLVVNNTVKVLDHISNEDTNYSQSLKLFKTKKGEYQYIDEGNNYWCLMPFISSTVTLESVKNTEQAYECGKAFGWFQKQVLDMDSAELGITIPDFHNIENRLESFHSAVKTDSHKRVQSVLKEIEIITEFSFLKKKLANITENSIMPVRITHNDAKVSNVLFDKESGEAVCVIDLDTVMPGYIINDFGDLVRSSTCTATEDEKEFSKVVVDISIFQAMAKGYVSQLINVLEPVEINNLVLGAKLITYEQAVRFLTDYLMGDVYYATKYNHHNLDRTRNQLALLQSIFSQSREMESIINSLYNHSRES